MEHPSHSAKRLRSGLSRLRSTWQHSGVTRHVVCGLVVHVILHLLLTPVLLFMGMSEGAAMLVVLILALFLGYHLEKAVDAKLCE